MTNTITLRAARVNAGLSLKDTASKIGKSSKTVSLWERGLVPIKAIDFDYLCTEVYKINPTIVEIPIVNDGNYNAEKCFDVDIKNISEEVISIMRKKGLTYEEAYAVLQYSYNKLKFESNFIHLEELNLEV